MLTGSDEELQYHRARAAQELATSNRCEDVAVSAAHLELSNLHLSRLELAKALRHARRNRASDHVFRTDKEC